MAKTPFTLRHVLASVMVASNWKSIILIFSGTNDSQFFGSSKGGHEGVKSQVRWNNLLLKCLKNFEKLFYKKT